MKGIHITLHLKADTPEQLSALTVRAQLMWGMELNFFDFMQDRKGKYVCWYKIPHTVYEMRVRNGQA
jgi:hypothetical protein